MKMSEVSPFCIESFYKFIGDGKLMAAKCNKCGTMLSPPKPMCTNCFSTDLKWVQLSPNGKLLTYTVIHVAPKQFEKFVPYPVGIVKLDDGPQLLGMIRDVEPEKLKVGMPLTVDFDKASVAETHWPMWPRYYFRPS